MLDDDILIKKNKEDFINFKYMFPHVNNKDNDPVIKFYNKKGNKDIIEFLSKEEKDDMNQFVVKFGNTINKKKIYLFSKIHQ